MLVSSIIDVERFSNYSLNVIIPLGPIPYFHSVIIIIYIYILLLLLLFHMDYLYTICLLSALHVPPVSPGTDSKSSRGRNSSGFRLLLFL